MIAICTVIYLIFLALYLCNLKEDTRDDIEEFVGNDMTED